MLIASIILFAIAAALGLILIRKVFADEHTSRPVVYIHGIAAVLALILLIISYINQGNSLMMISILIFIIAALGGFIMFSRDMAGKPFPKWLAAVHSSAAVIAFVLLLLAAFT